MFLQRYLGEKKMKLLKQQLELSMDIQLKTLLRWFMNKNQLRKAQMTKNKQGSAIIIIVKWETKAKKLFALSLYFESFIKVVEKYKEARPRLVCMIFCEISYERMRSCKKRPAKYIICIEKYKVKEH